MIPTDPRALQRQARDEARQGRDDRALALLQQAARQTPGDASIACDIGRVLAKAGDLAASLTWFERALVLSAASIEARFFLGVTLLRLGRPAEALPNLRAAHAALPDDPAVRTALADAAFHAGEDAEALAAIEAALALKPDDEDLLLKRGEVLSRLGRHDEALSHFGAVCERLPALPGPWMALAQAHEEAGDADGAEDAYRRAQSLQSGWPQPLAGLLGLRRGDIAHDVVEAAVAALDSAALGDIDIALLGYPLGRVYDARGERGRAFACWERANAAREREVGALDREGFEADVASRLAEDHSRPVADADAGASLVFVVGMPRSGTTLAEQILDAHPRISGCGELPFFAELAARVPAAADLDAAAVRDAAARYLALAGRHAAPGASLLVDKAPLNALHLGHVARVFPAAKVVWCRRDARDVGLSIFSENFAKSARFATSLASIAACTNAQHRLMRHWQRTLGLPVLELVYETVVEDLEAQVRRLLAFVGAEWDERCLRFHATGRVVQTPSRWQVRQPVHRGSVGRAAAYADALAPLVAALDLPIDADGVPRT